MTSYVSAPPAPGPGRDVLVAAAASESLTEGWFVGDGDADAHSDQPPGQDPGEGAPTAMVDGQCQPQEQPMPAQQEREDALPIVLSGETPPATSQQCPVKQPQEHGHMTNEGNLVTIMPPYNLPPEMVGACSLA